MSSDEVFEIGDKLYGASVHNYNLAEWECLICEAQLFLKDQEHMLTQINEED